MTGTNPNAIRRISVHAVKLPCDAPDRHGSALPAPTTLDSTVVVVETVSGLAGIGESCPADAAGSPDFAAGLRAALGQLAPALLGEDATQVGRIYRAMERALHGQRAAKAALDIACWDLFGKHCAQPVSALLGGRFAQRVALYAAIAPRPAEDMLAQVAAHRAEGYRRFRLALGANADEDIEHLRAVLAAARPGEITMADAGGGWAPAEARRVAAAIAGLDCYLEQPCAGYEPCLAVRRHCAQPILLGECIADAAALARALADDALDALAIGLSRVGGLTPARTLRDLCLARGLGVRIEDTAGGEIARAAQAQLAAATPAGAQLGSRALAGGGPPLAADAPEMREGWLYLNGAPGLGVTPRPDVLGEPVAVYG